MATSEQNGADNPALQYSVPPEALLLEEARKRIPKKRNAVAKVAKRAGISEGRWRQIAKGYQQATKETRVAVRAPADTLARMAHAVNVTADQLDEAGRSDAADIVRADRRRMAEGLASLIPTEASEGADVLIDDEDAAILRGQEQVVSDGWSAIADLAKEVLKSQPSEQLCEKTRRVVFLVSGQLILYILRSGHAAEMSPWLDRIYVERRQLYKQLWLKDGEPDYPWFGYPGRPEYGGELHPEADEVLSWDDSERGLAASVDDAAVAGLKPEVDHGENGTE